MEFRRVLFRSLSIEQKHLADARIEELGLEDSITFHLMDYRAMPPAWCHRYGLIHLVLYLETNFSQLPGQLRPDCINWDD